MKLFRSAPVIALATAILAATVQPLPAAAQSGAPSKSKSGAPARVVAKTEITESGDGGLKNNLLPTIHRAGLTTVR